MSRKRKNRSDGDYGDRGQHRDGSARGPRSREDGRDGWSDEDEEYSRGPRQHRRGKHGSDRIHNRGTKRRLD